MSARRPPSSSSSSSSAAAPRRAGVRACLGVVFAVLAAPALAATCQEALARLDPNEVVSDLRRTRAIEITPREMQEAIGPLAARGDPADLARLNAGALRRSVPVLWRAKLPRNADLDRMRVVYEVRPGRSADGLARRVGPGGRGDVVPIAVQAERPVETCRFRRWKLVEGGARIEMDVGALPAAGLYRARIRVRLRDW
ncbi:MAG: hypothetical protein AAF763_05095 [Pseudomonadota bacterium]